MRKDSRLSRMLHVLIHMDRLGGPATSERIAKMLSTNPVVVRRTMAGLREQGYVTSVKGHGGGWSLAMPLHKISLLDIHNALGESSVFTIGLSDEYTHCPIEQAVNKAIKDVLIEAESLLLERFGEVSLDVLAEGFVDLPAPSFDEGKGY
ncbi:Rrf2 family transcriptional regulator [Marinomonas aquiplantarum]|uniref:BadM/Rrf2 family transcriptional regulator n=1 Tax=Marinomonas aquiplantarum TaxID=491951 RepID=A0A366D7N6_9GAMM|nr:Rrf2 family transcriptional regulator [Marinomonas aquiplantarum]RBO86050.1 BadM/Rrf2 family transcriptional regulator [Marinomonas aquiplantarum]